MNDKIIKTHQFDSPINKVWDAISIAEEISKWFIQADFVATVGYEYTFTHDQTVIFGKVLKVNPLYELVYTWIVKGTDVVTTVSWKLAEKENGTYLILEHSGISNYPSETAIIMFNNFEGGWETCIQNLNHYLLNG